MDYLWLIFNSLSLIRDEKTLHPDGIQIHECRGLVRTTYFSEIWLFNSSMDPGR